MPAWLAGWPGLDGSRCKEGGGLAAAHLQGAAALPAGGRAAQGYRGRPSTSSVTVAAGRRAPVKVPGERTREVTLDLEPLRAPRAGTEGQASRPAPPRRAACPAPGARRTDDRGQEPRVELASAVREERKAPRIRYREVSALSRDCRKDRLVRGGLLARGVALERPGRGRRVGAGPGVAWPKSRSAGCKPATLATEPFPGCPPGPVRAAAA